MQKPFIFFCILVFILVLAVLLTACAAETPSPLPTNTATFTQTPTLTATTTQTATFTPTATQTPTYTPTTKPSATLTNTPTSTPIPTYPPLCTSKLVKLEIVNHTGKELSIKLVSTCVSSFYHLNISIDNSIKITIQAGTYTETVWIGDEQCSPIPFKITKDMTIEISDCP